MKACVPNDGRGKRERKAPGRSLLLITVLLSLGQCLVLHAQTRTPTLSTASDPRGAVDLTICSQNLENYGSANDMRRRAGLSTEERNTKIRALIKRFRRAGCDVIAVQELLAQDVQDGKEVLGQLSQLLTRVTHRPFETRVGQSNDKLLRNGFLIAMDRSEIVQSTSYARIELPSLILEQPARSFARGPLELVLDVKKRDGKTTQRIVLVNIHFKSQRPFPPDPAGLQFETYRMEMAEAVRRVVLHRHEQAVRDKGTAVVVLGDRNSHLDSASARILEGSLELRVFRDIAPCRIGRRGVPLCQAHIPNPARFFSVLTTDPQTRELSGTYHYKTAYSWLDDILLIREALPLAWANYAREGDYDSGIVREPAEASDHALVYARLNW